MFQVATEPKRSDTESIICCPRMAVSYRWIVLCCHHLSLKPLRLKTNSVNKMRTAKETFIAVYSLPHISGLANLGLLGVVSLTQEIQAEALYFRDEDLQSLKLPSRELTYPPDKAYLKMRFFSPGGIC